LTNLGLDSDLYIADVVPSTPGRDGGDASGTIKYDQKWSNTILKEATLPNTKEHTNQKEYINRAN
jgi:hypothetical protein